MINVNGNSPLTQLPNVLTLCNITMGLSSIITASFGNFTLAGLLIIIGAFFDRLDGHVARKYRMTSEMGKQLDSLADVITFGLAPAITMFLLSFTDTVVLGFIITVIFVTCGAYRLARFNILNYSDVFIGMPITVAGFLLALLTLFQTQMPIHPYWTAISMLFLSYLMVCKREIKKV
ncbi:CDP-diacylglycerol--serine O-phosphatidyltransferase [Desulfoscipio gibsoniae]|uniref:CDP-diacylglycerol--serine O-phosphatidyltransferase n=1 Tax=Desulfoscipio gibsoniae DSM 7213 TaxID=767817 RepID=R4KK43_9FIRM|nr:CDP-diacylglycerol--serine O-phosphatidyltransferase [Desulfoscipio gibsoniae]AGL03558.1 CDP-diacylglycerol--serine O-phosphatidyltransferase [Desulfoscipio gibsoniae DSM 7213]